MIPVVDQFEDVLEKAISGLGLKIEDLARTTGIQYERIEALLQGEVDELSIRALAPLLGLSADKLINMDEEEKTELVAYKSLFAKIICCFVTSGIKPAMNKFNKK